MEPDSVKKRFFLFSLCIVSAASIHRGLPILLLFISVIALQHSAMLLRCTRVRFVGSLAGFRAGARSASPSAEVHLTEFEGMTWRGEFLRLWLSKSCRSHGTHEFASGETGKSKC